MKRFIIAVGLIVLSAPAVFAWEQSVLARVTVYWAGGGGGSDRWTRQHKCATGARLRAGHCAVDPRRIPYGSKVTLPDATLLAVDTGSAVRSRKAARRSGRNANERNALVVDRFFETKRQALNWASRHPYFMVVRVSPPNFQPGKYLREEKQTLRSAAQDLRSQAPPTAGQVARAPRRSLEDRPRSSMYMR